jgi:hypothetical protein
MRYINKGEEPESFTTWKALQPVLYPLNQLVSLDLVRSHRYQREHVA